MKQKKSGEIGLRNILKSKLAISIIIFIAVSLVAVIAGNIIAKEGTMDVSGNFTTTGTGTFGKLNLTGNIDTTQNLSVHDANVTGSLNVKENITADTIKIKFLNVTNNATFNDFLRVKTFTASGVSNLQGGMIMVAGGGAGKVLTSDAGGVGTWELAQTGYGYDDTALHSYTSANYDLCSQWSQNYICDDASCSCAGYGTCGLTYTCTSISTGAEVITSVSI